MTAGLFSRILTALCGGQIDPALKKLRNRLLFINMLSLTLVVFVAFSIIYAGFYKRTQAEIDMTLYSIPRSVLENVLNAEQNESVLDADGGNETYIENEEDGLVISGRPSLPVDYSKSFIANITADGGTTVFSMLDLSDEDYSVAIETVLEAKNTAGEVNIAGRLWRYSKEPGGGSGPEDMLASYRYSIVFLDIDDIHRRLGELSMNFIVIGIFAIGVILLISTLIANRAIRPVEESMARQRRFVADASHELKTPIAVIAANAEAARDAVFGDADGGEGVSRWIDNIADETARMGGLVENLLKLAKAEERQADYVSFDLTEAVCEEADRVEAFLFEKNIAFDFELLAPQGEALNVRSDRAKVQAALSVLLENAVKYTPERGRVSVSLGRKDGKDAYVAVSNTGTHIPPKDLAHIFDRFYRADRSHNSQSGGHGIGLSLAKEIARSLGGELTAESTPRADGGAINTFTLTV